ncbi:MAG: sigma 54-interacting transcriptional regulator [Myxococcaceae bacterium]
MNEANLGQTDEVRIIAFSPAMRQAVSAAIDVSRAPTTVLLTGETGSGKEVIARFIHDSSARAGAPFTLINCGTLGAPAQLEAFATALAHGGTVVLDEISAIPIDVQGRLLTMLEGEHPSRIIATSHRDLREAVERGALRSDLFYRLDVFPIAVPPLRERREDIQALATTLLRRIAETLHRPALALTGEALSLLEAQRWNGNVRELANVLERATIRARGAMIDAADLGLVAKPTDTSTFPAWLPLDLVQLERLAIAEALRRTNGNRTHAARLLNLGLRTLRQKLNGPGATTAANSDEQALNAS